MERIGIVVAAPIRDRAWILPTWLAHLSRAAAQAQRSGVDVGFIFLENDSRDETLAMLKRFADYSGLPVLLKKHDFGYFHYKVPFKDRERANPHNDKRELAELRNMIITLFAIGTALYKTLVRYLVMWDSDVIMPSRALVRDDPRSLIAVMEDHPEIGTMCADVQHPHCSGRYHNYMLEVAPGRYNHPDRARPIPRDRFIEQFTVTTHKVRPARLIPARWDSFDHDHELCAVVRVGTTGGGGAAIIRREVLEKGARYGAHPQGEDIPLCETIRAQGREVAMYTGIRGLHVPRDLYPGEFDLRQPYGIWIEDWLKGE